MCNRPLCTIPPNSYLHMYEYDSFCHHHHPQPIARPRPAAIPVEMAPNGGAIPKAGNVANAANVANTGNVASAGVSPTERVKSRLINCIDTYDFYLRRSRLCRAKPTGLSVVSCVLSFFLLLSIYSKE